ncbi:hypothetical protein NDA01_03255 [Trichocoleus desertorum AS-A10]|uniref:hypothetical protein n=1 Tax=Trichocoleus desertorum TaxID=1481672 RepID=UPI003299AE61
MRKKILLWLCLGFASLPIACLWVANWVAAEQEKQSQQQWQVFTTRFADSAPNRAALQLEVLSARLGINLLGAKSDRLTPTAVQQFEAIQPELQEFLDKQLEDATDAVEPLPPPLQKYLRANADTLDAIRQQGLQGEVPQWATAMPRPNATQVRPDFAGFVKLQRLLAIDALEKNRLGQPEAAIANLEASWRLTQGLRDRPELNSQVVALIMTKIQAGSLRKMQQLPPIWQQRLMEHDYRQSFQAALTWESWLVADLIRKTGLLGKPEHAGLQQFWFSIRQPYLRLAALDAASKMRRAYTDLPQQNVCLFNPRTFDDDLGTSLALWNGEGGDMLFGFAQQWRTAGYLMLDLEFTQKVLNTKALKTPEIASTIVTRQSRICPHAQWIYRASPTQTWTLSFSQALERPARKTKGLVLPLTYRAKAQKI